jgi:hypothetical protein
MYFFETSRKSNWKRLAGAYEGGHGGSQDLHRVVAPVKKKNLI